VERAERAEHGGIGRRDFLRLVAVGLAGAAVPGSAKALAAAAGR